MCLTSAAAANLNAPLDPLDTELVGGQIYLNK